MGIHAKNNYGKRWILMIMALFLIHPLELLFSFLVPTSFQPLQQHVKPI